MKLINPCEKLGSHAPCIQFILGQARDSAGALQLCRQESSGEKVYSRSRGDTRKSCEIVKESGERRKSGETVKERTSPLQ